MVSLYQTGRLSDICWDGKEKKIKRRRQHTNNDQQVTGAHPARRYHESHGRRSTNGSYRLGAMWMDEMRNKSDWSQDDAPDMGPKALAG